MKKLFSGIPIHKWLVEPINPEVFNTIKRISRSGAVRHIAIMPDVHLSGDTCIGTVLAADSKLILRQWVATLAVECQPLHLIARQATCYMKKMQR